MQIPFVMIFVLFINSCSSFAAISDRTSDPFVATGSDFPSFVGVMPEDLVAFRFDDTWTQVPVQVDERDLINFTNVYNGNKTYGNLIRLDYTDEGTFTGPDSDPSLDSNDEIVWMLKDMGVQRAETVTAPEGVIAGTGIEVTALDSTDDAGAYLYLFVQDGSLDQSAGVQYVQYDFVLKSGDYKTTYKLLKGPNPEDSVIHTSSYERHFADRWKCDRLKIFKGNATGVDILDRHKNQFAPGYCGRSEDTFSSAEGGFIINKEGPVRAIRSYVGANSGPRTQRQNIYYESREDIRTSLRVHAIPAVMDYFDYSPAAEGMLYFNNVNGNTGFAIDGIPDSPVPGPLDWEFVTGEQGSLIMLHSMSTDIDAFAHTSYYVDDLEPSITQCTGDKVAYGQSGHFIAQEIPNTDPKSTPYSVLDVERTIYYEGDGATLADVAAKIENAANPVNLSSSVWVPMEEQEGEDPAEGEPLEGLPIDGEIPAEGVPVEGLPIDGEIPAEGEPLEGLPIDGEIPAEGEPLEGLPIDGEIPAEGEPLEGQPIDGEIPVEGESVLEGQLPVEGDVSEGELPDGEVVIEGEPPLEGESPAEGELSGQSLVVGGCYGT